MSLNPLGRLPLSSKGRSHEDLHSLCSTTRTKKKPFYNYHQQQVNYKQKKHSLFVVEAKGKKGMAAKQYQRAPPPPLPKLEDDGNPKFVVFIRMANVSTLLSSLNFSLSF